MLEGNLLFLILCIIQGNTKFVGEDDFNQVKWGAIHGTNFYLEKF